MCVLNIISFPQQIFNNELKNISLIANHNVYFWNNTYEWTYQLLPLPASQPLPPLHTTHTSLCSDNHLSNTHSKISYIIAKMWVFWHSTMSKREITSSWKILLLFHKGKIIALRRTVFPFKVLPVLEIKLNTEVIFYFQKQSPIEL